ncbi:MAG TPA: hypothetical protein VFE78_01060 [Gemmataceae bacterium]|jgi:hypothetical protein|nr:hypothetical protein [Gemmataceae bacterium]
MDKPTLRRVTRAAAVLLVAAVALPAGAGDQPAAGGKGPAKLAKELIGTWALVGTPEKVGDPPASGGRLKFITGRQWAITQADPETGKVIYHHGGTYTLDGDTYTETVEYANENTAELIKKKLKFKVKVEGDKYTQIGVGADNPFKEVWKRAK